MDRTGRLVAGAAHLVAVVDHLARLPVAVAAHLVAAVDHLARLPVAVADLRVLRLAVAVVPPVAVVLRADPQVAVADQVAQGGVVSQSLVAARRVAVSVVNRRRDRRSRDEVS